MFDKTYRHTYVHIWTTRGCGVKIIFFTLGTKHARDDVRMKQVLLGAIGSRWVNWNNQRQEKVICRGRSESKNTEIKVENFYNIPAYVHGNKRVVGSVTYLWALI